MSRPEPGEIIDGKYRVEAVLGEGGMGCVVRATHLLREAPVALKFLLPEVVEVPGLAKRFTNEAVAASALECENVIKVYDVGEREGSPYLVMEYLEGRDLESEIQASALEPPRAVHILLQVLLALSSAHRKGIIHRDLKPANVFLLQHEGEDDFVKLLDFGVSKLDRPDDHRLTATGSGLGTPMYMSPEQARNAKSVDARTDIYAAGAMLFQMLSGRPPFLGDTLPELLAQVLLDTEPRLETLRSDVPQGLADVAHKALEKEPDKRYQDADEFLRALLPFADERSDVIVARIRRKDAGGRGSVANIERRPSLRVSAPEDAKSTGAAALARTAEAPATQQGFSTAMQDSGQLPAPERKRTGALIGVVVGVLVVAGVGAVFALRSSVESQPGAAADSTAVAPLASEAEAPPAVEPSVTQSAPPAQSSAGPAASPPAPTRAPQEPRTPKTGEPPAKTAEPPAKTAAPPATTAAPPATTAAPPATTKKPPDNPLDIQIK